MSTTEGWPTVMWSGVDAVGVGQQPVLNNSLVNVSFFIGFMIVGKFFVLNMFTGAIISKFLFMQKSQLGLATLTDSQREWVKTQKNLLGVKPASQAKVPENPCRRKLY